MTHRIEMVPLSWLVGRLDPKNEKSHDLPAIKASIREHGFTIPALIDERTGLLGAGHGRVEALAEMFEDDEDPPRRIGRESLSGGDWLVPLLRDGLETTDDLNAAAYRIVDNRSGELGGWVLDRLTASLSDLRAADRLEGTGFTAPDLDGLLASMPKPDPKPAPDQSARLITRRSVLVDVADDASQRQLIDRLTKEGLKCRALNS
jgi:hypothetical protein